jgi:hypothetical protein
VRSASKRAAASGFGWLPAYNAEGHPLLALTGEEGVVTLEAWWHEGKPLGVLTIHSTTPLREGQQPDRCPLGGACYMDVDYQAGFTAAEFLLNQQEETAMTIMHACYAAYLVAERTKA